MAPRMTAGSIMFGSFDDALLMEKVTQPGHATKDELQQPGCVQAGDAPKAACELGCMVAEEAGELRAESTATLQVVAEEAGELATSMATLVIARLQGS